MATTTRHVADEQQGELQGVLASIASLTAVVGPLVATALYVSTKQIWLGATWMIGAALCALCVPLLGCAAITTHSLTATFESQELS